MIITPRIPAQPTRLLERPTTLDAAAVRSLHRAVLVDLRAVSGAVWRLARRRAEDGPSGTRRQALALESYLGDTCDSLTHHLAVYRDTLRPALETAVARYSDEVVPLSPTELVLPEAIASLRRVAHVLVTRPDDADAAAQLAADVRRVEALVRRHVQHVEEVVLPAALALLPEKTLGAVADGLRANPSVALFDWCRTLHRADDAEREHLRCVAPLRSVIGPNALAQHRRRVHLMLGTRP